MFEADPRPTEQIERLEAEIDELRESIRRSRRLAAAGRACAVVGAVWFIALMLGFVAVMPVRPIAAIIIGLGGIVLMGSSVGSTRQLELSLQRAENARNAAIDTLKLVAIRDGGR